MNDKEIEKQIRAFEKLISWVQELEARVKALEAAGNKVCEWADAYTGHTTDEEVGEDVREWRKLVPKDDRKDD